MWTGSDGDEGVRWFDKGLERLYFGRCDFSKLVSGNPHITYMSTQVISKKQMYDAESPRPPMLL